MPPHNFGPDPPARPPSVWTRADVEHSLKRAFRLMPYASILAPRGNTLQNVVEGVPDETFNMVAFSGTVLGDRSDERYAVLFWARSIATGGEVGGSVTKFCDAMGWSRATFDRVRIRACEKIARAKNEADRRDAAAAAALDLKKAS